jgi:hypothetical protein
MEETIPGFLELEPQAEQNSQKSAVKIGTGLQIDDKTGNPLPQELLVKGLKTTGVLERTPPHNLHKAQVGGASHQDFRYFHN